MGKCNVQDSCVSLGNFQGGVAAAQAAGLPWQHRARACAPQRATQRAPLLAARLKRALCSRGLQHAEGETQQTLTDVPAAMALQEMDCSAAPRIQSDL